MQPDSTGAVHRILGLYAGLRERSLPRLNLSTQEIVSPNLLQGAKDPAIMTHDFSLWQGCLELIRGIVPLQRQRL
jgi:hypothetical protein